MEATEPLTGKAGIEQQQGYAPMPQPWPDAPADETFRSDREGLRDAADELSKGRKSNSEPTPRTYVRIGGERAGESFGWSTEDSKLNGEPLQTITAERGARDLLGCGILSGVLGFDEEPRHEAEAKTQEAFCDFWVDLINTRPFALVVFPEEDRPETVH